MFHFVINNFLNKVPHLYERIQHHSDRQRFNWTKQARRKRIHSGGELHELKVEGAIPLATIEN
jgi:P2-related tail formation protein